MKQLIRLIDQLTPLFDEAVAEGNVELECPLPESPWQVSAVLGTVKALSRSASANVGHPFLECECAYWLLSSKLTRKTESAASSFLCRTSNRA